MSRTRVVRWTPGFGQALRLALRPALTYLLFNAFGFAALLGATFWYEHGRDSLAILLGVVAGIVGVVLGQLLGVLRVRSAVVFVVGAASLVPAIYLVSLAHMPFGEELGVAIVFFCFAFPCGMLSLQHRWELVAAFWPSVGWIGGVFLILNEEGRVSQWEQDKLSAWLPVPLAFLGGFLLFLLLYLATKQAMRVEIWQALSGAAARRVSKNRPTAKVARRNLIPLLAFAAALFVATAVLAPYLWRTGKGDHGGQHAMKEDDSPPRPRPTLDGDALEAAMRALAQGAKEAAAHLWPLLFLVALYRPAKRALLTSHLLSPIVPTPPTERVENLWEYVRIAAEDAGVEPTPSDSVEQLLARIRSAGRGGPALACAAEIYGRTRYGFTVARGDPQAMRGHAIEAGRELRTGLGLWTRIKNQWRPLA